ncbi:hypothetical protein HD554DRAFT_1212453 [Boletus coccyginus]|nr:hypothetical protein HD554DRAFT_1212453 [Boletus coccyginus]
MALREQSVAIAVIGVTRSGKTTFINLASGSNLPVSKSPGSCTTELKSSTFSLDGQTVMLIDTPGFDDTTPSVLEVLKLISDHFPRLQGVKLAGVIYMHCITDDHMRGPSRHNFHIFSKFCGDTSLRDVLIVTNESPGEELNDDEARKQQEFTNKDEFFGPAMDNGARMLSHDGTQASAHAIIRQLLNREPTVTPAAGDSPNQQTGLIRTAVGADAVRELTGQVEHHTKVFEELCQGIDAATLAEDEESRKVLQEEAKNSLQKIESIRYDLEQMVTSFAAENSRLEDENRRYKNDFTAQNAEARVRIRLLGEERRARELAEAQLAEERALWERRKMERESLREGPGPKYDKLFACGAVIFALLCLSRFALDSSTLQM